MVEMDMEGELGGVPGEVVGEPGALSVEKVLKEALVEHVRRLALSSPLLSSSLLSSPLLSSPLLTSLPSYHLHKKN
jgi:hypothetical protein